MNANCELCMFQCFPMYVICEADYEANCLKFGNTNIIIITSHRYPFCVFFNESRRTKVPKPYYYREKVCQMAQSDWPSTRFD